MDESKNIAHNAGNIPHYRDDYYRRVVTIPVQEAAPDVGLSIATAETVAATKAAIEVQYSTLLREPSPRSLRRQRFEREIVEKKLSDDERVAAYRHWLHQESDLLRQTRALKTTSLVRSSSKNLAFAGFDLVRVLGKGSFGTVCLVSER